MKPLLNALKLFDRQLFTTSQRRGYSLFRPPWWSTPRCAPLPSSFEDAVSRVEREFRRMEREFDRFFDRTAVTHYWPRLPNDSSPLGLERLHAENPIVQEDGKLKFKLVFDVSRFKPEEIDVKTVGGKLNVHAKHSSKGKDREESYEYLREFSIPDHVEIKEMTCSYNEDGSLTIEAPYNPPEKQPTVKEQAIKIKHE